MLFSEAGERWGRVLRRVANGNGRIRRAGLLAELPLMLPLGADVDDGGREADRDGNRHDRRGLEQRREQDQDSGHAR